MGEKSIMEYFKGKNIFITGATGFMGKALIEKLLRSCTEVENIYVLLRPRKAKSINERLQEMFTNPLFNSLKMTYPNSIQKVVPVKGDTSLVGLGLSNEDRQFLINNTHIFCNMAASVKFDQILAKAILENLRSVREATSLALEMKKLEVYMHVSTAYCNIVGNKIIKEILYEPHGDWKIMVKLAEEDNTNELNVLSHKILDDFPNTYVYTKQLAEHCLNDMTRNKIPTILFRPSVVISAIQEPFRGWLDNFNGPAGILVASGAGILRTIISEDLNATLDFIPVDNIVKSMIVALWHKQVLENSNKLTLSIYQGSQNQRMPFTITLIENFCHILRWEIPYKTKIWFPDGTLTKSWIIFYIRVILFQLIPAVFLDALLSLARRQPLFFKLQRKMYISIMAIKPFQRQWYFENTNTMQLLNHIPDKEFQDFNFNVYTKNNEELYEYMKDSCDQARRILLKEGDITDKTRTITKGMYYLHLVCQIVGYGIVFYWIIMTRIEKYLS